MRQKALLAVFALLAVLIVGAPTAFATNLLNNGSFENGDLSGWNTSCGLCEVVTGPFYAYSWRTRRQFLHRHG